MTSVTVAWGTSTEVPVGIDSVISYIAPRSTGSTRASDFDGDGKADITVYSPATGTWRISLSSTNYTTSVVVVWGVGTDVPVPGDYDGDGNADIAVYRPSTGTWWILRSTDWTQASYSSGVGTNDIPVPGDFDGDHRTDIAIYRPSMGLWQILESSTNYLTTVSVAWGTSTDLPLPRHP